MADARRSGRRESNLMWVQLPPSAHNFLSKKARFWRAFFILQNFPLGFLLCDTNPVSRN